MSKLVAHFQKEGLSQGRQTLTPAPGVPFNVKLKALCHVCEAFKTDTAAWVMWLCAICTVTGNLSMQRF